MRKCFALIEEYVILLLIDSEVFTDVISYNFEDSLIGRLA